MLRILRWRVNKTHCFPRGQSLSVLVYLKNRKNDLSPCIRWRRSQNRPFSKMAAENSNKLKLKTSADATPEMLKLCRVTKIKVFFLVLVYDLNFS